MNSNLTLEERERIAYITGSPDHVLIVEMLDSEDEVRGELQEELASAKRDADDLGAKVDALEQDLEKAEDKIQELEEQIEAAGIDLV